MGQIINGFYQYRTKDGFDKVILITKEENGEKKFNVIEKPTIEYYVSDMSKVEEGVEYRCLPMEHVKKVSYYYKDLYSSMVQELGDHELQLFLDQCLANNGYKNLSRLHLDFRVHGTDVNIVDHYIHRYLKKNSFHENNFTLTKLFYDIEVDGEDVVGFPDPELAEARVNIITGVYEENNEIIIRTFALKYDTDTFRETFQTEKIKAIAQRIRDKYKHRTDMPIKIKITKFDEEINLLNSWFTFVNNLRPDFVLAWNSHGFDNPYLKHRIEVLGYDAAEIMCPDEMPYKNVFYKKDTLHQDPADNTSVFKVNSYSNYIDLMNLYANLRKANGKKESYSLDYIGEIELGEHKDEIETSIKTLHNDNYPAFLEYNIQDVMLLYFLEKKNNDIDTLFGIAMITETRIEEALKKTVCLRNLASKIYEDHDYVLSNNRAKLKNQNSKKIPGAFVAAPDLVDAVGEIMSDGERSKFIFEEVTDQDLSSQYPYIILSMNISPETFQYKIDVLINRTIFNKGKVEKEEDDRTFEFIGEYISGDYVNVAAKYLDYPNVEYFVKKIEAMKGNVA